MKHIIEAKRAEALEKARAKQMVIDLQTAKVEKQVSSLQGTFKRFKGYIANSLGVICIDEEINDENISSFKFEYDGVEFFFFIDLQIFNNNPIYQWLNMEFTYGVVDGESRKGNCDDPRHDVFEKIEIGFALFIEQQTRGFAV